jgi:hypothetical protein
LEIQFPVVRHVKGVEMKRFKMLGLVSLALFVFGAMTAISASAQNALPDAFALAGGAEYPISLSGEAKALAATEAEREKEVVLFTETSKLPALAVSTLLTIAELTSLGTIALAFKGVHEKLEPVNTCTSTGKAEGEVAFTGEFHLVFNLYTPKLELAALILYAPFEFTCKGGLKAKISGLALVGVVPLQGTAAQNNDITNIDVFSHCFKAVQGTAEILSYFNDEEELKNVLVKSNIGGAENEKSCEEVKDTILLGIESGGGGTPAMFSILQ